MSTLVIPMRPVVVKRIPAQRGPGLVVGVATSIYQRPQVTRRGLPAPAVPYVANGLGADPIQSSHVRTVIFFVTPVRSRVPIGRHAELVHKYLHRLSWC